jgi:hypothetical protein
VKKKNTTAAFTFKWGHRLMGVDSRAIYNKRLRADEKNKIDGRRRKSGIDLDGVKGVKVPERLIQDILTCKYLPVRARACLLCRTVFPWWVPRWGAALCSSARRRVLLVARERERELSRERERAVARELSRGAAREMLLERPCAQRGLLPFATRFASSLASPFSSIGTLASLAANRPTDGWLAATTAGRLRVRAGVLRLPPLAGHPLPGGEPSGVRRDRRQNPLSDGVVGQGQQVKKWASASDGVRLHSVSCRS